MTKLVAIKAGFNPLNLHAVWGHNPVDPDLGKSFGPLVIAKDGAIPVVRSELISGEVRIEGKVEIGEHATVRRETTIYGSNQHGTKLADYALVMDYCRIEDSTLGLGAGFAHGGISQFANWGDWSFGNIEPVVQGTAAKPVTIEPGAYLGPALKVPAGGTVYTNLYYIGNNPAYILPNVHLDPETFEPTGKSVKQGNIQNESRAPIRRPIALSDADLDLSDKGELSRRDSLHFWRLGARPYKQAPFGDYDITQLETLGVEGWVNAQQRSNLHRPALANWLWYYPLVQHLKQISYLHEDAKQHGDIVWHSAIMQSDILQLDRVHRALSSILAPELVSFGVEQLIKSKLYLLGAYAPTSERELAALDAAFASAVNILKRASDALEKHTSDITVTTQRRATIDHALKVPGGDRIHVRIGKKENLALRQFLSDLALRDVDVLQKIALNGVDAPQADEAILPAALPHWLQDINPNRINFATLTDGPIVRGFGGQVPVIEDDVTLVGRVDISGAVHIGAGAILDEGSYRSEQTTAPVFIGGQTYINNSIAHSATKEKYPVHINGDKGPIVVLGGHLHGIHILPNTYAKDSLLSDEGHVSGVIADHTFNAGEGQASKNGEVVLLGGSFSVNVLERSTPTAPLSYPNRFTEYQSWWAKSPFKDIALSEQGVDETAVKGRIHSIYQERAADAGIKLAEQVEKYGELYRVSAQLQAALLQTRQAAQILETQNETVLARQLSRTAQGLEYVLGIRDELSAEAAAQLGHGGSRLQTAAALLQDIAARGETISIPDWNKSQGPYGFGYEDGLKLAKDAHRPVTRNAQRNFEMANRLSETKGLDHVIKPEDVLKEGLRETLDIYPNALRQLAAQLTRIPGQIEALQDLVKTQQNRPKVQEYARPQRVLAAG